MKFLGVDFGTKRIGVALSDDGGTLAFPEEIVPNDENKFDKLGEMIRDNTVEEIVVGESLNFKGEKNKISEEIKNFTEELKERFGLAIHMEKEFLTSVEARRYKEEGDTVDSAAAALILQRFLDKNLKKKK